MRKCGLKSFLDGKSGNGSAGARSLEPLIVNAKITHAKTTVDKTYAEIVAAVEAGRTVYARAGDDLNGWSVLPFSGYMAPNPVDDSTGEVYFSAVWAKDDGVLAVCSLIIDDDDVVRPGWYTNDNSHKKSIEKGD